MWLVINLFRVVIVILERLFLTYFIWPRLLSAMLIFGLSKDKQLVVTLLSSQQRYLLLIFVLTILAAMTELLPFFVLYKIFNAIINYQPLTSYYLIKLALVMAGVILLRYILYSMAYYCSHQAAYSILTELRYKLVNNLAYAPLPWLQQHPSGKLKQMVIQDVERVETFVAHHTVEGLAAIICPLTSSIFLFWVDWRLALAALAIAPVVLLISSWTMRGMAKDYDNYLSMAADLDSATIEYVRNIAVMKVFNLNVKHFQLMRNRLANYYLTIQNITHTVVGGWSVFSSLLSANILFILPVGIILLMQGEIELSAIALAIMLGAGILKPLMKINQLSSELTEVLAGLKRLVPILTLKTTPNTTNLTLIEPVTLQLLGVTFSYQQKQIIHDVNLELAPATVNLLMGSSGSGKSTIAQLMAGLLIPDKGEVCIAGIPLQLLAEQQKAKLIGLVTQEPFLFQGTILDNLCFTDKTISEQQLTTAVKVAQAEDIINNLPAGYQTLINEQGLKLSGGERQRLAIARALLMDTNILILDEATAFADNITQKRFYQALRVYYPHKTILVIAHNSYGAEKADQIIIMDNGRIQAIGQHQQLLDHNLFYQSLWQQQQSLINWSIVSHQEER